MIVRARKRKADGHDVTSGQDGRATESDIELDLGRASQDKAYSIQLVLGFFAYIVVLGFRWDQAVLGAVVDSVCIAVAFKVQGRYELWRSPEFSKFFPKYRLSVDEGRRLDEESRLELFRLLSRWPKEHLIHLTFLNALKSIPVTVLAIFVFDRNFSFPVHAAVFLGMQSLVFLNFLGLLYVAANEEVSRFFARVHERDEWSTTFQKVEIKNEGLTSFRNFERLSLAVMVVLLLMGIAAVLLGREWESPRDALLSVLLLVVVSAGFVSQAIEVYRRILIGGLLRIVRSLDELETQGDRRRLPFSSWPFLQGFESRFNLMLGRLESREREVGRLIGRAAEDSRSTTIGEMASLVIHDIGNPLQMAQFCAVSLGRASDAALRAKLQVELEGSLERLSSLVQALRTRVEGRPDVSGGVRLGTVHAHVCRFLDLQLKQEGFNSARWVKPDSRIHQVTLQMTQADLFQVIENLYRNSFRALRRVSASDPILGIRVGSAREPGKVSLEFFDNGPGLTPGRFEQLTSSDWEGSAVKGDAPSERGLGLRLTRKLIESLGGSVAVLRPTDDKADTGARIVVVLPGELAAEDSESLYV